MNIPNQKTMQLTKKSYYMASDISKAYTLTSNLDSHGHLNDTLMVQIPTLNKASYCTCLLSTRPIYLNKEIFSSQRINCPFPPMPYVLLLEMICELLQVTSAVSAVSLGLLSSQNQKPVFKRLKSKEIV